MGKRRAFIYAVKKSITCESKERREKNKRKSRRWFRSQRSTDSNSSAAENATVVPLSHSPTEEVKLIEAENEQKLIEAENEQKLIEAENEQNRHAYSVALVTAMAAEAAVAAAQAAAEVVRLRAVVSSNNSGKTKEEVAAIKIQTAFRGYLARRALKALRGLVRLKSLIGGKTVERQASATLKCMQTLARVQSEVRLRRIKLPEENLALQLQVQQKHEKEVQKSRLSVGENWDDSARSKEQIEAHLQYRQEAAMRRERALAYAYSHQQPRRSSTSSASQTFMDPNNPRWGWNWLERWMAARPWENGDSEHVNVDRLSVNVDRISVNSSRNSISTLGDHTKNTHSPKIRNPSRFANGQSPKSRGKIRPVSPNDDDAKSVQSERCGRRSVGGSSSVRDDDESHASSPVPSYMATTESARAKSRLPSPLGTPEKSGKKRISFSGSSPAAPRRHSAAAKADASPTNDVAMRC